MSRGWSKNIIQKNPCFFRTSLIQIIFNTVSWVGPVFWRLLFWIEVISIQYSKAFKSCMCPLLSGPTLQRIQLLFPPGAGNLPAFHRGLISSSEAAPVGMFFLLLLLTNISQRNSLHHPAEQPLLLSSTCCRSSRDAVHVVPTTFSLQELRFSSAQWEQRWFSSELWAMLCSWLQ